MMFLGEVEYGDNFGDKMFLSQLTLAFFVFGLSIVLMNVLTGVAVAEVQEARSSHWLDLANRCYDMDEMAFGPLRRLLTLDKSRKVFVFPNDKAGKMVDDSDDDSMAIVDNEEIKSMTRDISLTEAEKAVK